MQNSWPYTTNGKLGMPGGVTRQKAHRLALNNATNCRSTHSLLFLFGWMLVWKEIGGAMEWGDAPNCAYSYSMNLFSLQAPLLICTLQMMQCSRSPWLGLATRSVVQGETRALVGPMTPKAKSLQIRNNKLSTPIIVSGIHNHSKTSKLNVIYNNPCLGGQ